MKRVGIIISLFLGAVVLGALNPCLAEDKASPTDKSDKAAPAEKAPGAQQAHARSHHRRPAGTSTRPAAADLQRILAQPT